MYKYYLNIVLILTNYSNKDKICELIEEFSKELEYEEAKELAEMLEKNFKLD